MSKNLNTLDDLLEILPGLRRVRAINADLLRTLLDRRKGECTWCGDAVPKGMRTWCGTDCVTAFQIRCSPGHAMQFVLNRDGGICQACGRDTVESQRQAEAEVRAMAVQPGASWSIRKAKEEELKAPYGWGRGQWREVDHDIPVIEGGGLCPVENLRLLCGACHADATKKLASKRSKKARTQNAQT